VGLLRLARNDTTRIELDETDYLEVRADISKNDFNNLIKKMPQDIDADKGFTPGQATDFGVALFDTLVLGWSLQDEKGKDVKPTVDMYLALSREAADEIDRRLAEHFQSLTPKKDDLSKSEDAS
jgi:hypothetical protein